jgi:Tol biopolymer transport system component
MHRALIVFFAALTALAAQSDERSLFLAHMSNPRQLTHGGENAEAYWSPDGARLIFQSTRGDAKCDQIYIMNADGSDQHMVSTGKGRTTCGYFLPDGRHIVYASTHAASPECPPPADRSKGYVWAVYPTYDLYTAKDDGSELTRLTTADGYDAEATVNFKTKRMIFTSLASGDLDLWSMNLDGSDPKQLTHEYGYDGGPVFSRDGRMIAWRASHPSTPEAKQRYAELLKDNLTSPMKMELYVARADGSHVNEITRFGCASFAPTFTPDGKEILFSSNKHDCDGRKFELYLVNVDGTNLRQITNLGGFTSFPEFSPDGKKLVFVSDWKGSSPYEFNVFTADWK